MPRYFLGVDIGATKSHALVADDTGQVLGFAKAGPGNHEIVGYKGLARTLQTVTKEALAMAGLVIDQLAGAGFGVAGYDWPSQRELTLAAFQRLRLGQTPLEIVNDTLIGLLAGTTEGWGLAVVAGTSCNCWGWDRHRRVGRMTGLSTFMGEAAGASELVAQVIRTIAREWTQRGPATHLTPAFVKLVSAQSTEDLLEGLCLGRYKLSAAAAPVVFQVAAEGDPVAQALITWAGHELGDLALGVIHQLKFEALTFEVVLVGSLYNGGSSLIEPLRETIQAVAPGARLVRLTVPPVVGGVLLGMEQAGINPWAIREALIKSTNELLSSANH